MQSSIWKLLTAAGIIGIGTFVVLEVEKRITESRRWSQSAETSVAVAGTETDITPDAQSEFDRMVQSELLEPPEDFDKPGTGTGTPAPPSSDEKFVGVVDQKVRKEDLTDGGNPFAMDEPELSEPLVESESPRPSEEIVAGTASSAAFASEDKVAGDSSVQPVRFEPDKDAGATAPAVKASSLADETAATTAKSPDVKAVSGTVSGRVPVSPGGSSTPKAESGSKYTFFGSNQPQKAIQKTSDQRVVETAAASTKAGPAETKVKTEATTTPVARSESASIPVKDMTAAVPAVAKAADEPLLSFPTPVPDVTQPPASSTDDGSPFERGPFDADTPQPIEREPAANPPTSSSTPDPDLPAFQPFDPDTEPVPSRPADTPRGNPDSDPSGPGISADEPFPSDSRNADERPVPLPDTDRPLPRQNGSASDSFPEPTYRDRSTPPFDVNDPLDSPVDRTGGDRPRPTLPTRPVESRDSGARTEEPFEMDETNENRPQEDPLFGDDTDVRPLPSADDLPLPGDRTRPRPDSGRAGGRTTEASRTEVLRPQLTIQKLAPNTASVGVPHKYTIVVANEGDEVANDVLVEDQLGAEASFVDSRPVAEYDREAGKLSWRIPRLDANEKREIVVTIKPTGEGTLDGVATVGFKAQVKSETVITAPRLELEVTGPSDAKVGSEVPLQFIIRNRGTSDASSVILRSVLPPALQHPEGADLEYEIETLRAGDEELVDLSVVAAEPGDRVLVSAEITSNAVALAKGRTEIEVVGAQLTLERRGPERRFVGRSALYQNVVTNESRFEAVNATVVEEIPEGSRFVSASNGGSYDAQSRRVTWMIPRLPAGKQLALEVELVTDEAGEVESIVEVVEDAGFRTPLTQNTTVTVEDLHNVTADISRQDEPVAIGEQFGFTVTIENRGTAVARNVLMSIQVPLEIRVLAAGTRQLRGDLFAGNLVKYQKVAEIQPNETVTFQIKLQGQKPIRNAPVKASLTYDEMPEPLVVSESVTVFDDRP